MSVPQINAEILEKMLKSSNQNIETENRGTADEIEKLRMDKMHVQTYNKKARRGSRFAKSNSFQPSDLYKFSILEQDEEEDLHKIPEI